VDKLKELVGTPSPVTTAQVAEEAQPKVNQNDPDAVLWTEAQKGNRADDYQVYIDTYPKGKYIPFAKARIKKFKEVVQTAVDQQEQQAWEA
jgi:tRNA(Ser,Leu) C12 N-acetylase TAN1